MLSSFSKLTIWLVIAVAAGFGVASAQTGGGRLTLAVVRFARSLLNACFVSEAEYLLCDDRVALWIHGHTHDSFDYCVRETRVMCNLLRLRQSGWQCDVRHLSK